MESVNETTMKCFEIFLVDKSKLDSSFSDKQFSMHGYVYLQKVETKIKMGYFFNLMKT